MRPLTLPSGIFASRTRGTESSAHAGIPCARQIPASSTATPRFIGLSYLLIERLSSAILPQVTRERRIDAIEPERYIVPRGPQLVTGRNVAGVLRDAQLVAADLPFPGVFSPNTPAHQHTVLLEVVRPMHSVGHFLADHLETDVLARQPREFLLVSQSMTRLTRGYEKG